MRKTKIVFVSPFNAEIVFLNRLRNDNDYKKNAFI
jgi:hypothetical protein